MNTHNTHSKMICPISTENITIISYPPIANWLGGVSGSSEIICPYREGGLQPACDKETGKIWKKIGSFPEKNKCIIKSEDNKPESL